MRAMVLWIALGTAPAAWASERVATLKWPRTPWHLVSESDLGKSVRLATLERPRITGHRYALRGYLAHELRADAYLEMWSVFAGGARFFSRTRALDGPMRPLQGKTARRRVVLPFVNRPRRPAPVRVEINLVFTGRGAVDLGAFDLVQFDDGEDLFAAAAAWWSARTGGWIGGLAGSLLGLMAALLLWLARTGRRPRTVIAASVTFAAIGTGLLATGTLALAGVQPYAVSYPLLLLGGLAAILGVSARWLAARQIRAREMRRMEALDKDLLRGA